MNQVFPSHPEIAPERVWGFSRNVFFLGLVSFFNDISSEMTLTILPLFLANVLGVRTTVIGLIEGVGESTGTILRVFSGWLSDRIRRRKALATVGYGLSTLVKPLLYLANAWGIVLVVRFADRVGKGIRTSPRDALVADSTPEEERGKSFGFHRTLDTSGAFLGLVFAAIVVFLIQRGGLALERGTYQTLVLVGVIPAILAVLIILLFVHDPRAVRERQRATPPAMQAAPTPSESPSTASFKGLGGRFQTFLGIMVIFTLGNSSDAFLVLRAQNLGLSVLQIFLLLAAFNLIYALSSLPAGILSDRLGRRGVIITGWLIYGLIYLGFGLASAPWQVVSLFVLYGLYYGATEGVARAYVADMVAPERRGTAYGLYHGAVGITALPSSLVAGWLWSTFSPAAPFYFGAVLALVAVALLSTRLR